MRRPHLTPAARSDLRRIAQQSKAQWGQAQAKHHLRTINAAFDRLTVFPEIGIGCGALRVGYRKWAVGSHLIFYRADADRIEIIRILHQRMDVERHLR